MVVEHIEAFLVEHSDHMVESFVEVLELEQQQADNLDLPVKLEHLKRELDWVEEEEHWVVHKEL